MDSDGDGMTNGEELGDPQCVWIPGNNPNRTTHITHPGNQIDIDTEQLSMVRSMKLLNYRPQTKFAKVMFLQVSAVHGGGGCVRDGGMHGRGHVWQGGLHGRGHVGGGCLVGGGVVIQSILI